MQSSPYNLNKELPIPNGSPGSRKIFHNHHNKNSRDVDSGQKTTSSSSNLFAKLNVLNPLRSQPPTPPRVGSSSPFRIVHTPDRTPLYLPPRPREPKTNTECREALEEMYAVSRDQQQQQPQRHAIGEISENARTGLQMHPNNSYRHQRYVSIMQDSNSSESQEEEKMLWVRMRLGDLKKRILQGADSEGRSYGSSNNNLDGGDGTGSNIHRRPPRPPPPPPLPLKEDTRCDITPRSMMPPGRLYIPPPPRSPRSMGPALETIPASPASPSTPTTMTATATGFSWRGPASAGLPPTSSMTPSPPRRNMVDGGSNGYSRGHKRIASTGSQPLRPPRPLSERPLISVGGLPYSKDAHLPLPHRPMTTTSLRSPASAVSFAKTATTTPTTPTFGGISENIHGEEPRIDSPIELREYEELTTRRSRSRIPMSSAIEDGSEMGCDLGISNGEEVGGIKASSNRYNSNSDNGSGNVSGSGSGNVPPIMILSRKSPVISILTSTPLENRCFLCTTPIAANMEICGDNCQSFPRVSSPKKKEGQRRRQGEVEYSDSEYDEASVGRRTSSPKMMAKMQFPPSPLSPTASPGRPLDFSPASTIPSPEEERAMTSPHHTIGWSRISSPARQLDNHTHTHSRASSTSRSFSTPPVARILSPPPPKTTTLPIVNSGGASQLSPRCFSPSWSSPSPPYSPGLRKTSASSSSTATTATSSGSGSVLSSSNEPSSALFHLERSIKNDPSWSPLMPGASPASLTFPAGHEVLRLGRVPSGEGHQLVVVRAGSVSCSSRESSSSSSRSVINEEREAMNERKVRGGSVVSRGSGHESSMMVVVRRLSREEGDTSGRVSRSSTSSNETNDNPGHRDDENGSHNYKTRNNSETMHEAGGSYGDWFSYYAEETWQNNAAAAAAAVAAESAATRYVHSFSPPTLSSSTSSPFLGSYHYDSGDDPQDESLMSPITNCKIFSNRRFNDHRRRMVMTTMDASAGGKEEEGEEHRKPSLPVAAKVLTTTAATTATNIEKIPTMTATTTIMRRRRSSIYDRIQSIYDAYADISGGDGEDDDGEEGRRHVMF